MNTLRYQLQATLITAAKSSDIFSHPYFQLDNNKSMVLFRENNIDQFRDQIQQMWDLMNNHWDSFVVTRNINGNRTPKSLPFYKNIESWLCVYKFMQAGHIHPHWSQY